MKKRELENLEEISQLISKLERVEAPNNFAFRLRARIQAEKQKRAKRKALLARLSYALSAIAIIIAFTLIYNLKNKNDEIAQLNTYTELENYEPEKIANPSQKIEESSQIKEETPKESHKDKTIAKIKNNKKKQLSRSEAASLPKTTELLNKSFLRSSSIDKEKPKISVLDILKQIGVEGNLEEDGFKVSVVITNSLADKSGIKSEDLVLAIDEIKLNADTQFEKLEIKKLKIRRGTKDLIVFLKP